MALHVQNGEERIKREGTWLRRWKNSGRSGMETLRNIGAETDMKFLNCREEELYERKLMRLVGEPIDTLVTADFVILKAVIIVEIRLLYSNR